MLPQLFWPVLSGFLVLMNTLAFAFMAYDKRMARLHRGRIRERTLLLLSFFGGGLGGLLAMCLLRHKTLHVKFTIGLPVAFTLQVLALGALYLWDKGVLS